ncbi:MAG: helix-turn-helix domain-containing protein [Streptosporangiaceae bacterium]
MSIGESLADARRQAGLTVAQVSHQTRIRESIIRDIEQGDFSACGGDFYARGHIRSIAGAVGTDPVPLISEYDADHGPPHAMRAADVFEPSRPIKIRERHSPSLAMIVVVVLLAIIGFSAYHLATRGSGGKHLASAPPTSQPSVHPTVSARPSPTPSPTHSAVTDVVIKVAATEECWVLLTDSNGGSQIYMGVVQAGTSMTWTEQQAVSIRLGNPGGVVLTVNGKRQATQTQLPVTLSFTPGSTSASSTSSSPSG